MGDTKMSASSFLKNLFPAIDKIVHAMVESWKIGLIQKQEFGNRSG